MAITVGAQLDNYRIVEKVGEGGMGAVFRAIDVMLERDVALKVLRPELAREPDLVERFRTEAIVLARLNHQFIAPVYGLHRFGEDWFIAMEYVPGDPLDHRLRRLERLPPDAAMYLTSMVLQALDYAHRLGVVHRDIKPANVIVTPAATVKVMDFGIARVLGSERRTRAGVIVGTLSYMAPEQIQGSEVDQRADLYSVGVLLYEMLSGRVPFHGDTDWALMKAQVDDPPRPLRERAAVPEPLEAAVMKALEKQPGLRFQTAAEFHHALEVAARQAGFMTDAAAAATSVPTPPPGRITAHTSPAPGVQSWEETRVAVPTPVPVPTPGLGTVAAPQPPPVLPPLPPPGSEQTRLASETPAVAAARPAEPLATATPEASRRPAPARKPAASRSRWPAIAVGALALTAAVGGLAWSIWSRQTVAPGDDRITKATGQPTAASPPEAAAQPSTPPAATQAGPGAGASQSPAAVSTTTSPPPGAATPQAVSQPEQKGAGRRSGADSATQRPATRPAGEPAGPGPASERQKRPTTPAPPTPGRGERAEPAPAPSGAVAGTLVFHNVRLARPGGPEVEVDLQFEPSRLLIMDRDGQRILRGVPYGLITSAEFVEVRRRVFVQTTRFFLVLHGAQGEVVRLRLERENAGEVVASFEQRWGRTVTRSAPKQDEGRP